MQRTQLKDALRTIRARKVSWAAMTVVAMIGCAIFLGAYGYADSLDLVAADFFNRTNYLDLKVSAVPGLNNEDIEALRATEGVADVEGTYVLDAATLRTDGQDVDVSILALTERVSVPEYAEGIAPQKANEVALSTDLMDDYGIAVGDTVTLDAGQAVPEGFLKEKEFTVTGRVLHGDSFRLGWNYTAFVAPEALETALVQELYSTAYVDVDVPKDADLPTDDYTKALEATWHTVEDTLKERAEAREEETVTLPDGTQTAAQKLGYVVVSRDQLPCYLTLRSNTQVLRKVSTLFAVIFVAVSVVVTVSTITILVGDEIRLLGAMKALGFTNAHIVRKYLVFSMLSIVCGMILAVPAALTIEYFIDGVMGVMFCCGAASLVVEPIHLGIMTAMELALCAVATTVVTLCIVRQRSAVQLLAGSRATGMSGWRATLAQRSGKSLYAKLIVRNLVSDFARVLVSIIIVASSCLIIGMGLAMRASFQGVVGKSVEAVTHYDLRVDLGKEDGADELDRLETWLDDEGATHEVISSTSTLYQVDGKTDSLTLIVADDDTFEDYFVLRSYQTGEALIPRDDGVIIAERISEQTDTEQGDTLTLFDAGLQTHQTRVDGVARIYWGRLVFMSRACYSETYGVAPQDNAALVRLAADGNRAEFVERLQEAFPTCEVTYPDELPRLVAGTFETVFSLLILLMLVLALLLSVLVLLNLANIFVHRRRYELTVMAINGFGQKQLVGYLLRETLVTIGLGLALGVLVGSVANEALIRIAEVGEIMLVRDLDLGVWLMAALIETLFAIAVYLVAFRQLRSLDITDATR